jgi:predicted GNAT superfamily acetyltransferase
MNRDTEIIIRDYRRSDYHEVNELWEKTGLGGSERGDNSAEVIKRTLNHGGKLLIMEETENVTILGTSWITNNGRRTYIHHFGIKPEYQHTGLEYELGIKNRTKIR